MRQGVRTRVRKIVGTDSYCVQKMARKSGALVWRWHGCNDVQDILRAIDEALELYPELTLR